MPLQKRVGELPAVATIVGTDQLIVSSANATKRCTVQQVGAFFQANGTYPPASHTHTASQITDFTSAVIAAAPPTTNASLLTSGTLADARLSGNVVLTNDARLSDARTPLSHTHTIANVTGLQSALDAKATPADVTSAVAAVVNAAPASLDTLKELADALGNDASFATTVTNAIAGKAAAVHTHVIADVTGLQTALDGKASVSHAHSATDVTSGTFDIARLPVGTSSTTVAAGNDARFSDQRVPTDGSVTDAKITSGGLSTSSLNWAAIQPWAANTAYAKGDLVSNNGIAYRRSAAGTSGASFNTANWQQITPSEFVGSQITSGTVPIARLGTGSPSASNFLRGDGTFAAAGSTSASDLSSGTLANARLTTRQRASTNLYLWSSFR